ncbi:MAG: thiamine diphosphokinase [Clostridia bacterium]
MKIAIILNSPTFTEEIEEELIICADGGYRHIGDKIPIAIVGDFDSLNRDKIAMPKMVRIIEHPVEKNYTDGELAVRYAIDLGATELVLYGALGGKIEHILGNLALLKLAKTLGIYAEIHEKGLNIYYTDDKIELSTNPKDSISILPYGGTATVENSFGLYYPLINLTLKSDDTRGISNVATSSLAGINVIAGAVLVFHYFSK